MQRARFAGSTFILAMEQPSGARWCVTEMGFSFVVAQLAWCKEAGVRRAIFTHCGSAIVRGDTRKLNAMLRELGREYGIDARIAFDGDRLCFPDREDSRHDRRQQAVTTASKDSPQRKVDLDRKLRGHRR
jgi:hypothetical protein